MNRISITFRADSSAIIGSGHIMRCLTLANALHERGANCHFVCRDHAGNLSGNISEAGHGLTLLPVLQNGTAPVAATMERHYASWLGADAFDDANDTIACIRNNAAGWLVVDHYAIDERWERRIKEAVDVKILVIDGHANWKHACDLLLDQTLSPEGAKRWQGLVPDECEIFAGPAHALLRPEFRKAKGALREHRGAIRRIFIGFGGLDQPNATEASLDAVMSLGRTDIAVDVVVGATSPHVDPLRDKCKRLRGVTLHVDAENVAELMAAADFAIGGGGGMMVERAYLALPALVISIAENQVKPARAIHAAGGAVYLGRFEDLTPEAIRVGLEQILHDTERVMAMHHKQKSLCSAVDISVVDALLTPREKRTADIGF